MEETPVENTLQDIVAQLKACLVTVQEVAARTDSLVDQAILEEACAEMARCLEQLQVPPGAPQEAR